MKAIIATEKLTPIKEHHDKCMPLWNFQDDFWESSLIAGLLGAINDLISIS